MFNSTFSRIVAGGAAAYFALRAYRELNAFQWRDTTVLVTGGSRGLGLVICRELLRRGARVAICARGADDLQRARQELQGLSDQVVAVSCDLSNLDEVRSMVAFVNESLGPIDVLINNAGTISTGPLETMTLDDFKLAMNAHFWGALHAIIVVLPQMQYRQRGRIVNISSIGGLISVPHLVPYSASKFALVGLSQGLRSELLSQGIVVTTVCPGLMRTGSPRNALFKGQHRAEYAWFTISDSLPGLSVSAEHAARSILAACSRGDAQLVISLPAKLGALIHGIAPGLTADVLSLVNRVLPRPGGIGTWHAKGKHSHSVWAPSLLTRLTDLAAERNNQVKPYEQSDREALAANSN